MKILWELETYSSLRHPRVQRYVLCSEAPHSVSKPTMSSNKLLHRMGYSAPKKVIKKTLACPRQASRPSLTTSGLELTGTAKQIFTRTPGEKATVHKHLIVPEQDLQTADLVIRTGELPA